MRTFSPRRPRPRPAAFTLIELLVTVVILLFVLVALLQFMGNVEQVWKSTAVDPFGEAEDAFETIANRLANATLEPYQDYADSSGAFRTGPGSFVPDHLARRSDLAFVCGNNWLGQSGRITTGDSLFFVAPQGYTQTEAHQGLERLLNALGYFVEFSDESAAPAFMLSGTHRWRWRLKEIVPPSEALQIYTLGTSSAWVQAAVSPGSPVSILAENVAALVVLPERAANDNGAALAPAYSYDSRATGNPLTLHQLPPRVRLALVAIDEASAQILAGQNGAQPPALVPGNLFTAAASMDADLASLDTALTSRKIKHRILEREILLPASAWTNLP
jgi:uncharacterized protein (TIGR02599 family)